MLSQIMTKISGGVTFLGGVLIVFGLVNLGMTIKDGMQPLSSSLRRKSRPTSREAAIYISNALQMVCLLTILILH